jgi:propanol-preferring alcohol dehydrogenase
METTLRGWLFTGANEPIALVEREDPPPGPGQSVIEVRAAGLCHSDVSCLDGTIIAMMPKYPIVLGSAIAWCQCRARRRRHVGSGWIGC